MFHLLLVPRRLPTSPVTRAIAVALAFLAAAELGHFLSFPGQNFATFWPANGLLLAALLSIRRSEWPLVLLATLGVNLASNVLVHGQTASLGLAFCGANLIEAVFCAVTFAWLTRGRRRLNDLRTMLAIIAVGIVCTELGAAIGAAALYYEGVTPEFFSAWRVWWTADALGILIAAPLVLAQRTRDPHPAPWTAWQRVELAIGAAFTLWLTISLFTNRVFPTDIAVRAPLPVLLIPCLVWAALRYGLKGATLANAAIALAAVYHTSRGVGPFTIVAGEPWQHAILLQLFLGVSTLVALTLGASASERRRAPRARLLDELRKAQREIEQLRALLNASTRGGERRHDDHSTAESA